VKTFGRWYPVQFMPVQFLSIVKSEHSGDAVQKVVLRTRYCSNVIGRSSCNGCRCEQLCKERCIK
jgi:hypothetical protein